MNLKEFILLKKLDLLEFENYWLEGELSLNDRILFNKENTIEVWEIEFQNWLATKDLELEIHNKFDKEHKCCK
jgi:hypothetical protein